MAGTPDQHHQPTVLYRQMRIRSAQREIPPNNVERFLAPDYACGTRADFLLRDYDTVLPEGVHVWCNGDDWLWRF